ncbi:glycosyltransferase family 2 protein [Paracoccus panacisoli]|uniref:Glycosyltransferase family 2 protein n=1 Tax=Paracoccus panacisoli TaxID=1510163 RepID=A0ABV6T324_9RHOB
MRQLNSGETMPADALDPTAAMIAAIPPEECAAVAGEPLPEGDQLTARTENLKSGARPSSVGETVLFTSVRNEATFLIEWIAYHKVIGFERIIVFANASDDGTEALLEALAAAGEVEYYFHTPPERVSAQGNAARIAKQRRLIPDGAWTIWLDADEFLNVRVGAGMVGDLIARLGDAQGILINWRLFGDAGRATFGGRHISAAFSRASLRREMLNTQVKTLFRWGGACPGFAPLSFHRPAIDPSSAGDGAMFLNGRGGPLSDDPENRTWLAGANSRSNCTVPVADRGHALAQINHYCVRSPEYFLLKRRRGSGTNRFRSAGQLRWRQTNQFYRRHNRNDVEETSILRHEAATTAEMARLRALPGVATAEIEALHRTAAMIAAIPPEEFAALVGEPLPKAAVPRSAT